MTDPANRPARLTVEQLRKLAEQARRVKYSIPLGGDPRAAAPLGRGPSGLGLIPAIVTTAITAASGTTPGTGAAQFYYLADPGSSAATADADNAAVTVRNWYTASGTVAIGKHIYVFPWAGAFWLAGADC